MADDKTKVFSAMRARTQENIARQKAEEYTPTTQDIREAVCSMGRWALTFRTEQFDQWLAAHDEAVRADMQPREVRTVEELDALPDETAILDKFRDVWQYRGGLWCSYETGACGSERVFRKYSPITVLFTPNQQGAES